MVTYEQWMRVRGREETTIKTRMSYLKHLEHEPARPLEMPQIRSWMMRWSKHAPRTRYAAACSIRSYLRYCAQMGLPAPKPEDVCFPRTGHKLPPIPPSAQTMIGLISVQSGKVRVVLELLYGSGLRISEVAGLTVGDVRLKDRLIKVRSKKRERLVPITRVCADELGKWLEGRSELDGLDGLVFPNGKGQRCTRQDLAMMVKKATKEAGMQVYPHMFRHAFAVHLLEEGAPLHTIQKLLGHVLIRNTQVYLQVDVRYLVGVHSRFHPHGGGGNVPGRQW